MSATWSKCHSSIHFQKLKFKRKFSLNDHDNTIRYVTRIPDRAVEEGGYVTLTGVLAEPLRKDKYVVHINWGDGTRIEIKNFPLSFLGRQIYVRHRYHQNREEPYQITLDWHDHHGVHHSDSLSVQVNDLAAKPQGSGPIRYSRITW